MNSAEGSCLRKRQEMRDSLLALRMAFMRASHLLHSLSDVSEVAFFNCSVFNEEDSTLIPGGSKNSLFWLETTRGRDIYRSLI